MTRSRFRGSASITLVLALALIQSAIAQAPSPLSSRAPTRAPDSADRSYKIYSLDDFGNDPGFCEWIAQTIPEVIAAGTWKGPGAIRYYAPKNILVVCHTSAVQMQVDSFLKDVKKSLPKETKARAAAPKGPTLDLEVVPSVYHKPELRNAVKLAPEPVLSYPVPAQAKPPKHLFHFIIRYEGDGIIDDNVVKAMKDYYRAEKKAIQTATYAPAATVCPATPAYAPAPSATFVPPSAAPTPPVKEKEEKKDDKGGEKDQSG